MGLSGNAGILPASLSTMPVSQITYIVCLLVIAAIRLVELRVSSRNESQLKTHGATKMPEPNYAAMVALHTGILIASAAEVVFLARPLIPWLALGMATVFVATNGVRWWVIRTLAGRWSVHVVTPARGIVSTGPFRYVRHPNYSAVFVEMIAIPLLHTAWLTALVGAVAHILVLRARVALEESVLLADPDYRAAMASKPRFVPRLF